MFAFIMKRCGWIMFLTIDIDNYSSDSSLDNVEITATKKATRLVSGFYSI